MTYTHQAARSEVEEVMRTNTGLFTLFNIEIRVLHLLLFPGFMQSLFKFARLFCLIIEVEA